MKIPDEIKWPKTPSEAREIQNSERQKVILQDRFGVIHKIAGVDIGFREKGNLARGAVVVLEFPSLKLIDSAVTFREVNFPYVPGFLSFREIPVLLDALRKLKHFPDLIVCDGQGIAHPRRFGLASHLGVLLDVPTIGSAKSHFIGTHEELPSQKGSRVELREDGELLGYVYRSRDAVKPIYISPGHRI